MCCRCLRMHGWLAGTDNGLVLSYQSRRLRVANLVFGGGIGVRNYSQFFRNLLIPLACVLVPYVSTVQRCRSLRLWEVWLRHRNFPATFCNWMDAP